MRDFIIYYLVNFCECFSDLKTLSLLDKTSNGVVHRVWNNIPRNRNLFYQKTKVYMSVCQVCFCTRLNHSMYQIPIIWDLPPVGLFVVCRNWRCVHTAIMNLRMIAEENKYQHIIYKKEPETDSGTWMLPVIKNTENGLEVLSRKIGITGFETCTLSIQPSEYHIVRWVSPK